MVRTTGAVIAAGLLLLAVSAIRARSAARAALAEPSGEERRAAVETVRLVLTLTAHLRASGGDPRFAERIPASPPVLDALQREISFASHLGDPEEASLQRLEIYDVRRVAPERFEVDAREYWVTRTGDSSERRRKVRSDVLSVRYVVGRQPGGWAVLDWDFAPLMNAPWGGG